MARWLTDEYPAIARQARRDGATVLWGDEMGLRSDHVAGTSYAPVGQTPVVRATGQRFGCNLISAITNRGELSFMVFRERFCAPVFVEFMRRLLKNSPARLVLIVDGHPVHRSGAARRFAAAHADRLRLVQLPGYCPTAQPRPSCSTRTSRPMPWARAARPPAPSSWRACAATCTGARSSRS